MESLDSRAAGLVNLAASQGVETPASSESPRAEAQISYKGILRPSKLVPYYKAHPNVSFFQSAALDFAAWQVWLWSKPAWASGLALLGFAGVVWDGV